MRVPHDSISYLDMQLDGWRQSGESAASFSFASSTSTSILDSLKSDDGGVIEGSEETDAERSLRQLEEVQSFRKWVDEDYCPSTTTTSSSTSSDGGAADSNGSSSGSSSSGSKKSKLKKKKVVVAAEV